MNAQVKVIIEGCVRNETEVVPTSTLISDGDKNIIVDPGMGENKKEVFREILSREKLTFDQITDVFITHYHPDHTKYVGIFTNAKLIDYLYMYDGNRWLDHSGDGFKITSNVSIMRTPGHSAEHASLVVKTKRVE